MMREVLLVMAGGAVGSGMRYLVSAMSQVPSAAFPWPTLTVNVIGSFVLGLVAALSTQYDVLSRQQALLLGTGLCGGFTTFSTFSVEMVSLIQQQRIDIALLYFLSSFTTTIAAAWLGVLAARSIT